MRAADLATRVTGAKPRGDEWLAICPAHDDQKPSLTFRDGDEGVLLKCHAGCRTEAVCERIGLQLRDLFFDTTTSNGSPTRRIIKTYDYHDAAGVLLYQAVRYEPKDFRQRRPNGHGGWTWDLNGVRSVVYQLPNLAGQLRVYIAEGEKDVERLRGLGLPATCNSGGAGKWTDKLTQQLKNAGVQEVVILPDNDDPGHQHAQAVARSCVAAGLAAKIISIPNLPPKGDVSDFFDAGGTVEQLQALVEAASYWVPDTHKETPPHETREQVQDTRLELDCDIGDLDAITTQAWQIILEQNNDELFYRRGTIVVRLETEDNGWPARLVELTDARLRYEVARLARCTKSKRSPFGGHPLGREDCKPPLDMIRNMLAAPPNEIPLPIIRGIVEVPVVSPFGALVQTPGFDPDSELLYLPYDPMVPIAVPSVPTLDDLAWARSIIDEILTDFPFASNADRTNDIGAMVLPFVRHYIKGPTPNHLFEGPGPGTGKGLLAGITWYPAVGSNVGIIADARDDDEMRKRITARLLEGCAVTLFDNITRPIDSGVISAAITARQWEDRRLGKTETLSLPVFMIWAMTANNPTMSLELARRTVRIRLDPKVDRPWLRDGFKYPDLLAFIAQERASLIRAILTLVQGWLAAGEPAPTVRALGSFESWTRVVGGILEFSGYTDFLGNALALYEVADSDGATWRMFTELWWAAHQDQPVSVKDLFVIADGLDSLYLGKAANERGQRTALGAQLRKRRDQVVGIYRIEAAGSSNNAALWRLRVMAARAPASPASSPASTDEECDLYVD